MWTWLCFCHVQSLILIDFFFFASYSNEKSEARISEAPVEASSSSPSTDPPQVHKTNSLAL